MNAYVVSGYWIPGYAVDDHGDVEVVVYGARSNCRIERYDAMIAPVRHVPLMVARNHLQPAVRNNVQAKRCR